MRGGGVSGAKGRTGFRFCLDIFLLSLTLDIHGSLSLISELSES
jgi:hypothetical protein